LNHSKKKKEHEGSLCCKNEKRRISGVLCLETGNYFKNKLIFCKCQRLVLYFFNTVLLLMEDVNYSPLKWRASRF